MSPLPLEGIKVLDWTRLLPGPFATLVLGDLGAQVDKLEDPQGGDYLRHMPPQIDGTSSIFLALNRNKRSVCLDLKKSGEMRLKHIVNGLFGTVLMLFVIVGSVYPVPTYPYNELPYLFFAYMAIGAAWFALLKWKSPQVLATIQHDMEE